MSKRRSRLTFEPADACTPTGPRLRNTSIGDVFRRDGYICMAVKPAHEFCKQFEVHKTSCGLQPRYIDTMKPGEIVLVPIVNLGTGTMWLARGDDVVEPVTARVIVEDL